MVISLGGPVLFSFCFFQGHFWEDWDKVWNKNSKRIFPSGLVCLTEIPTWHEMGCVYFFDVVRVWVIFLIRGLKFGLQKQIDALAATF